MKGSIDSKIGKPQSRAYEVNASGALNQLTSSRRSPRQIRIPCSASGQVDTIQGPDHVISNLLASMQASLTAMSYSMLRTYNP